MISLSPTIRLTRRGLARAARLYPVGAEPVVSVTIGYQTSAFRKREITFRGSSVKYFRAATGSVTMYAPLT